MTTRTGPTNPVLLSLIQELKKKGKEAKLWERIAFELERPTRKKRVVNLARINKYTEENETIVVPGKVLGSGPLDHKLTIAAFSFSQGALDKIHQAQAKAVSIKALLKENIKGKQVRIIG
jgi:large subunit ribosomal protein L18e